MLRLVDTSTPGRSQAVTCGRGVCRDDPRVWDFDHDFTFNHFPVTECRTHWDGGGVDRIGEGPGDPETWWSPRPLVSQFRTVPSPEGRPGLTWYGEFIRGEWGLTSRSSSRHDIVPLPFLRWSRPYPHPVNSGQRETREGRVTRQETSMVPGHDD